MKHMLPKHLLLLICMLLSAAGLHAQKAYVSGTVRDESGKPLEQAVVADEMTGLGGYTNAKGYYQIEVSPGKSVALIYGLVGYVTQKRTVLLNPGETRPLDVRMKRDPKNELPVAIIKADHKRSDVGNVYIDLRKLDINPGPIDGVEGLIKTLVGNRNELSSQYAVRGGNFDENLVYVNDFEIYRPFLVRAGQQEGLSFVNSDMVSNVNFSVGGFQAKYGDKMSSVLDVTYKRPEKFAGTAKVSMLGANAHLEGITKNKKLTYLIGARQKSNQYLLQSQPTKGVYNPSFTDIQALVDYRLSAKWELEAIGNYARNRFTFFPERATSSFGVLNQSYQLDIFYRGSEHDQFDSRFAGVSATYRNDSAGLKLKFLASGFQTNEFETYDINGAYLFGELQTDRSKEDYGQIKTYLGAGGIHSFARNYLNVNVGDLGMRGTWDKKRHFIQFGANATTTHITDQLHEWERRDSAGFTQPYDANALRLAYFYSSSTVLDYNRFTGFVQDMIRFDSANLVATVGIRFNYSMLNSEFIASPRLQLAWKPRWDKRDVVVKFSAGQYAQPPFYREMRDMAGAVNTQLRAQKSVQVVLGADYNFKMYERPFKVTGETYYKNLWDLDPYRYDNVRIRYTGKNNAIGYVYGGELRFYGDISKDATSWVSIGIMKAEQKITDSGMIAGYNSYFALPSDQRFMLGMYFEDYLRKNKNFKVHINGMFASGLPQTAPGGHLYQNTLRIPSYKRVDIGFSALLLDSDRKDRPAHSLFNYLNTVWASLEVFNLLSIQNTLSYTWIQDRSTQRTYAVPNRLTNRLLNVKLLFNF